MPPKKVNQPNKKTVEKQKEKVIEDKTFGLKNKKGAKQQKYIKMITHQVKSQGASMAKIEAEKREKQKKKEELDQLNSLFKPVVNMPKISKDADPKSVLCPFFKMGACGKGERCKFSHDLSMEGRTIKKSIYVDSRQAENDEDNMENWDEEMLQSVVSKKHGEANKAKSTTAIICKYFLQAIEENKYGWFWECPNGSTCIYRHAVPSGFILKKDREKLKTHATQISLEELIEKERANLGSNLTPVNLQSFLRWKERKRKELLRKKAQEEKKKRNAAKAGKEIGLSGRELFTYNPDLVGQDDEEADENVYANDDEEDDDNDAKNIPLYEVSGEMFLRDIGVVDVAAEDLFNLDDISDDENLGECDQNQPCGSSQLKDEIGKLNIQ